MQHPGASGRGQGDPLLPRGPGQLSGAHGARSVCSQEKLPVGSSRDPAMDGGRGTVTAAGVGTQHLWGPHVLAKLFEFVKLCTVLEVGAGPGGRSLRTAFPMGYVPTVHFRVSISPCPAGMAGIAPGDGGCCRAMPLCSPLLHQPSPRLGPPGHAWAAGKPRGEAMLCEDRREAVLLGAREAAALLCCCL